MMMNVRIALENKSTIYMVHWPGQDTPACNEHLRKLLSLASVMGFQVSYTPVENTECENCRNTKKAN
jgi:hypothetical protein